MGKTGGKPKIVVTTTLELYPDQVERLKKLGEAIFYDAPPKTTEEWLERCKDADIICTGKFGFTERIYELPGKFFSCPFIGLGWLDVKRCKEKNIKAAGAPGGNSDSVAEWIIAFILNLLREQYKYFDIRKLDSVPKTTGLWGKHITVLGKGNIGSRVGKICKTFEMKVTYFERGDNLLKSVSEADVVVNTLSHNSSTENLLDKKFFFSLKKGSYFITVTSPKIYNVDAMIEALDKGILAGVGDDAGDILPKDTESPLYQKLRSHPKILATPHISYSTDVTNRKANDIMIDNIEAWIKGKPINLVT